MADNHSYRTSALQTACLLYATESDKPWQTPSAHLHATLAITNRSPGWERHGFLVVFALVDFMDKIKQPWLHLRLAFYFLPGCLDISKRWKPVVLSRSTDTDSHVPRSTDMDSHVPKSILLVLILTCQGVLIRIFGPRSTDTGFYNCTSTLWLPHWNPYLRASEVYDKCTYSPIPPHCRPYCCIPVWLVTVHPASYIHHGKIC